RPYQEQQQMIPILILILNLFPSAVYLLSGPGLSRYTYWLMDLQTDWLLNLARSAGTLAAILLAAFVLFRSRTPRLLREELEIIRAKLDRVEAELKETQALGHTKDIQIAELRVKTDVSDLRDTQQETLKMLAVH